MSWLLAIVGPVRDEPHLIGGLGAVLMVAAVVATVWLVVAWALFRCDRR